MAVYGYCNNSEALIPKRMRGGRNAFVLHGGDDDFFALHSVSSRGAGNGEIIRLRGAPGKDKFIGAAVEFLGDALCCARDCRAGNLTLGVEVSGVGVMLSQVGEHRVQRLWRERG